MKHYNKFLLIFLILLVSFIIGIKEVYADTAEYQNNYSVKFLADDDTVCESLLGPSFKRDLEQVFKIMLIAGPLIVLVLTTTEFISAIVNKDDDAIKKCASKLTTRLVLIVVLFFLPILLNLLLSFLDDKYTTCIDAS